MDLKDLISAPLILLVLFCSHPCFAKITIGVSSENGESLKYSRKHFHGELKSAYSCVINHLDTDYDVITVPQARLIKMLQNNEVDIAMPLLLLPQRDLFAVRSATIYQVGYELISQSADSDLSIENLRRQANLNGIVYKRGTGARTLMLKYLGIDKNESLSHEQQVSTWQQAVDFVAKNRAGITALPTVIAKDIEPHHFIGVTRIKMPEHQLGLYMSSRFAKNTEATVINDASKTCKEVI
ncbi:hypothetical protein [Pseudoalteromonas gelatinilytica]|uniref:Solute-binding protein family 3/N-terminal domain-containing protein n=1 Tax=Pseudoalteromonas gelatinilytica TaxID=1703256 RepID=A0ABQ1T8H6_9GAMM|nr:hypothetical protein [Pseudoalteromonas profundi]GGE87818.1 hypothetical protein GCM10008027_10870 [Pseudoalteromonas profundi]